ncbi:MAG: TIGR03905 family TSCPD domain-containing protein [Clostridia bacterium]|nr:TIGR03905 family TSCPD domain-containing protein [Clostridia bacterium]
MESYRTVGTCSRQIIYEVEDGILKSLKFINGCSGNTQGVSRLAVGMKIDDIIARLQGVQCRNGTSCPDQLAKALIEYKKNHE